jgi:16S rRNA (cytosine967-C5)-methyltransferase
MVADSFEKIKPDLLAGRLSIQDRSAGKVIEYMNPQAKTSILDFCSAPGGKTCYIAEFTKDKADIVATDSDEFRLTKVKENIERLKLKSITIKDKSEIKSSLYDQVLVDIPCSGLGVISKRIDLVHHFSVEKLNELKSVQLSILDEVKQFVEIGGELIVSTCTIIKQENLGLIELFLSKNDNFSITEEPMYCLPFDGKSDGAFAIKLKKNK